MCKGPLSKMNQEEIVNGMITYEDEDGYKFTDARFFNNDITQMQKAFHLPHTQFSEQIKNSRIIIVIKNKKVKEVRRIIRKLKEAQTETV